MNYDDMVSNTAIYHQASEYLCLALIGEVGELANVFKKEIRNQTDLTYDVVDECGDICWYLVAFAHEAGKVSAEVFNPGYKLRPRRTLRQALRVLVTQAATLDAFMEVKEGDFAGAMGVITDMALMLQQLMYFRDIELDTVLAFNIQKIEERKANNNLRHN